MRSDSRRRPAGAIGPLGEPRCPTPSSGTGRGRRAGWRPGDAAPTPRADRHPGAAAPKQRAGRHPGAAAQEQRRGRRPGGDRRPGGPVRFVERRRGHRRIWRCDLTVNPCGDLTVNPCGDLTVNPCGDLTVNPCGPGPFRQPAEGSDPTARCATGGIVRSDHLGRPTADRADPTAHRATRLRHADRSDRTTHGATPRPPADPTAHTAEAPSVRSDHPRRPTAAPDGRAAVPRRSRRHPRRGSAPRQANRRCCGERGRQAGDGVDRFRWGVVRLPAAGTDVPSTKHRLVCPRRSFARRGWQSWGCATARPIGFQAACLTATGRHAGWWRATGLGPGGHRSDRSVGGGGLPGAVRRARWRRRASSPLIPAHAPSRPTPPERFCLAPGRVSSAEGATA